MREQRASQGGLFIHQEDLHGVMSVNITLQECFKDADRESVPLCYFNEGLEGLEEYLVDVRVI